MRHTVGTTAALLAPALAAPAAAAAPATTAAGATGLWRMDGYGTVLAIDGRGAQEYQTTAVSCLKGYFATAAPEPGTYDVEGAVISVRPAPDGEHARFGVDVAVGHRQLRRIGSLPAACTRPSATDPRTAFDVMTRTLPNGMAVWLPNEEYLTRTGTTFDGTGVPPRISGPVFTDEEFTKGRDSAFDRAVELLRSVR
ncbi:hypothetical protein ACIRBZ_21280 [Streptomyces sp. NPDC094038]|uniref:hypothetical protein n=1 Tax=Streptomyces sp. NPDC094038 TaxID=3366055 RepID=UPI0037F6F997